MKLSSPTSLLLNLGHAMDHWVIAIFLYTASVIAGVWGTDWKELTPYAFGASFMFGAGSIVSGKLGDSWGRRSMMILFFAGLGVSCLLIALVPEQVADRRRAHPDGRLRLDLPSGRHPDDRPGRGQARLRDRRERPGRQSRHRHRRQRLGAAGDALRLADGLHRAGRRQPGCGRAVRRRSCRRSGRRRPGASPRCSTCRPASWRACSSS